jgi:hypothetical protein
MTACVQDLVDAVRVCADSWVGGLACRVCRGGVLVPRRRARTNRAGPASRTWARWSAGLRRHGRDAMAAGDEVSGVPVQSMQRRDGTLSLRPRGVVDVDAALISPPRCPWDRRPPARQLLPAARLCALDAGTIRRTWTAPSDSCGRFVDEGVQPSGSGRPVMSMRGHRQRPACAVAADNQFSSSLASMG